MYITFSLPSTQNILVSAKSYSSLTSLPFKRHSKRYLNRITEVSKGTLQEKTIIKNEMKLSEGKKGKVTPGRGIHHV